MKLEIKKRLAAIREERGATDPILVLATIAVSLILLVGGTFAVTGIITNGKDLNAKGDLDKISIAETSYYAQNDSFIAYDNKAGGNTALEDSNVGFSPTEDKDAHLVVVLDGEGWNAASKSSSGKVFVKTSESNLIVTSGSQTPADLTKLGLDATQFASLVAAASAAK